MNSVLLSAATVLTLFAVTGIQFVFYLKGQSKNRKPNPVITNSIAQTGTGNSQPVLSELATGLKSSREHSSESIMRGLKFTLQNGIIADKIGKPEQKTQSMTVAEADKKEIIKLRPKKLLVEASVILFFLSFTLTSAYSQRLYADYEYANELGISGGGFHYNAFAPEWYLRDFSFTPSAGIFYRRQFVKSSLRVGYGSSKQTITSYGGGWMQNDRESTCNQKGSVAFIGVETPLWAKGAFCFYAGSDVSFAHYQLYGKCESYNGKKTLNENKKMNAIGVNPFMGASLKVLCHIKISLESNVDIWRIREKNLLSTDPQKLQYGHALVTGVNPLNTLSVSFCF